jgi:hypothetical protein
MIRLATDQEWLHKAAKEIAKFWRNKRQRQPSSITMLSGVVTDSCKFAAAAIAEAG